MRLPTLYFRLCALALLLCGLTLLVYPQSLFDLLRLGLLPFSKDGIVESLSPVRTAAFSTTLRIAGEFLVGFSILGIFFPNKAKAALKLLASWITSLVTRFWQDFKQFWQALKPEDGEIPWLVAVAAVMLVGLALRLPYLAKAMGHDEAYTYIAFASRPLLAAISDYHLPNNHVFHTLLVLISTRLLGDTPWALRLPALAAGVFLIPAVYRVGKQHYHRAAGLIAAGSVAALPVMIDLSTSARGYTLITLLALLCFWLAAHLQREDNLAAWLLLALCGALGMWAVPLMLYPLGSAYTWLSLNWIRKVIFPPERQSWGNRQRWQTGFMIRLLVSGLTSIILTLLLYLPVFYANGMEAVTANVFVLPLSLSELMEVLPGRIAETVDFWFGKWIVGGGWFVLAGFLLSLALHRRTGRQVIPLQAAVILFCVSAVLIQRPNPWAKVWSSLLAPVLMWSSAGWVVFTSLLIAPVNRLYAYLWQRLSHTLALAPSKPISSSDNAPKPRPTSASPTNRTLWDRAALAGSLLVCALLTFWSFRQTALIYPGFRIPPGAPEQAARFIQAHYQPGDLVATVGADSPALYYYMAHFGIDYPSPRELRRIQLQRVIVVVDAKENQTVESVLKAFEEELRGYRFENWKTIGDFGDLLVYVD
jgi:hypothetical protein